MDADVKTPVPESEEPKAAEAVAPAEPVKPGEKTDPALLLKSLQEERRKRQEMEAEIARLQTASNLVTEPISDEGRFLKREIDSVKDKLAVTERENQLLKLQGDYPVLRDKSAELEAYMAENPGMKLETAAKAFLAENGLLEPAKPRKGLEPEVGGGRQPVSTGMTPDEVDDLRVNNYNEYARRIRAGQIKF